jgi:hypothetical protein
MPAPIRSVAVFCGSRLGHDPAHAAAARALGTGLAKAGLTLIFGGGGLGLMGVLAGAALAAGGRVHGVIPEFLMQAERAYPGVSALEVTPSMHARKTRMFEMADACVALSGGLGTLDETVEMLTWRQLGLHAKPLLILDVNGWARPFVALIEALIAQGFVSGDQRDLFRVVPDVETALDLLRTARVPAVEALADRL